MIHSSMRSLVVKAVGSHKQPGLIVTYYMNGIRKGIQTPMRLNCSIVPEKNAPIQPKGGVHDSIRSLLLKYKYSFCACKLYVGLIYKDL